jgi:hypothetical protein
MTLSLWIGGVFVDDDSDAGGFGVDRWREQQEWQGCEEK